MTQSPDAYEVLGYPARVHHQTHIDRLATLGVLHGLNPAPLESCRVLEVGCAHGTNLLAMAHDLPGSEFVGMDLTAGLLDQGRESAAELGLDNVRFQHGDLADWDSLLGEFDYIIAHGVYSWVPPQTADRLLALCGSLLTSRGLAFVSYVSSPVGHFHRAVRETLLFHSRRFEGPLRQAEEARTMLGVLSRFDGNAPAYLESIREVMRLMGSSPDSYLRHDILSDAYEPCSFMEFMTRAGAQGLQFVSETEFAHGQPGVFPSEPRALLESAGDRLLREQYIDFFTCRGLRQSILCRVGQELSAAPEHTRGLWASAAVSPDVEGPPPPDGMQRFRGRKGSVVETDEAPALAMMDLLRRRWPRGVGFAELTEEAAVSGAGVKATRAAERFLFELYQVGFVQLQVRERHFVLDTGDHPVACPMARMESRRSEWIPTRRGHDVHIPDPLLRDLLRRLDGSRSRVDLEAELGDQFPNRPVAAAVGEALPKFARGCILIE